MRRLLTTTIIGLAGALALTGCSPTTVDPTSWMNVVRNENRERTDIIASLEAGIAEEGLTLSAPNLGGIAVTGFEHACTGGGTVAFTWSAWNTDGRTEETREIACDDFTDEIELDTPLEGVYAAEAHAYILDGSPAAVSLILVGDDGASMP
ncbi:hypothetical protein RZO50_03600 [Microbacterium sp. SSW1-59]|uniref:hypothetical protein n=1 Tax=Microbacterium xanthum TaxID=3079794 RepID=UPI002AD3E1BF|nr:hypothetical protein [Microbacterium sp. SSW1-59]MDZ8200582.1 hypothetical protein [Microbacterium sp. SSW1-59]